MPRAVKALIAVICIIAVIAIGEIISVTYHSDAADVIAFETDNPYIATDSNTQISAHRSGGGIMPEETMMAFKIAPKTLILQLIGLNLICTLQKIMCLFFSMMTHLTEHLTAKRFSEKRMCAPRIKHMKNSGS